MWIRFSNIFFLRSYPFLFETFHKFYTKPSIHRRQHAINFNWFSQFLVVTTIWEIRAYSRQWTSEQCIFYQVNKGWAIGAKWWRFQSNNAKTFIKFKRTKWARRMNTREWIQSAGLTKNENEYARAFCTRAHCTRLTRRCNWVSFSLVICRALIKLCPQ